MSALYRKYRPQTFAEVVGQEAVVRTLTNALESGKVRQAYLFAGPRGTGKTSLARILAKCVNCQQGPTATPDGTCNACMTIANGSSLDVVEMDAASQRGIDDIREIRERVVLAPVEGRSKVYIVDEAHQLTDAAWNALLKLIEEPPPHLLFIFCTTELYKVLPTVRSRCQTFVFQRPRLPDLMRKLRRIADAEGIEVPDAALALIARGGRGAFRDAESTLDQLSTSTGGAVSVQDVLALLGAVEDEVLFRLCDLVVDSDSAGALVLLEQLSEQGQDLGRVVSDLLEHLRHLMLVQHTGQVPETLPVTDEAAERLREQAHQLGTAAVVRLIELLHAAVEDARQGADPRLLLELALVKATRHSADISLDSLAFRVAALEEAQRPGSGRAPEPPAPRRPSPPPATPRPSPSTDRTDEPAQPAPDAADTPSPDRPPPPAGEPAAAAVDLPAAEPPAPAAAEPPLELAQLQEAWKRTVLPALERRGAIPTAALLAEAHPQTLAGNVLTLGFPGSAKFHRERAEEQRTADLIRDVLFEVTGRHLTLVFTTAEPPPGPEHTAEGPVSEDEILELMKSTFDARELEK